MGSRRVLGGLFVLAAGWGAGIACSSYVPPDVPNYGPPNGIVGKTPNGPSGTSSPAPDAGAPAQDGGATPSFACVTQGGQLLAQTTPCPVSWKTDIYPKMASGGKWNCAGTGACHGGATPTVLTGDSHAFYVTLANYTGTVSGGTTPYFNPCSTDPTKSDFVCNVQTSGTCGVGAMPLGVPIADAGAIVTWVTCGAPEN